MKRSAPRNASTLGVVALALAFSATVAAADGSATGTLTYKSKSGPITIAFKHVWLFKGPDAVDATKSIRHLIFSATDIGAKVTACKTMNCTDADLGNGMTVDLDAGRRLNYWVSLNDQRVQYSGTAPVDALKLTTESPSRLAGKLSIDDTAAGGPKVEIEFDAPLTQELKLAR